MNINKLYKETQILKKKCEPFLSIAKLDKEERKKLEKNPTPLQIKAFDTIVEECKREVINSDEEKMAKMLRLLYDIEIDPLSLDQIERSLEKFTTKQLQDNGIGITEKHIEDMQVIVENIEQALEELLAVYKNLLKEKKKWYAFGSRKLKIISQLIRDLAKLKSNIELQMEYDAKHIAEIIIDDFYNIYIYFSYLIRFAIANNYQLLGIQIANFIDRYIKIINPIFNNRSLKSQDMLYHYVLFELRELKITIFKNISSSYDRSLI